MKFPARLEGGPFDGDSGWMEGVSEVPPCLWAVCCPCRRPAGACENGGIQWVVEPIAGGEKYVFDHMDDRDESVAVYLHADIDYDGIFRDVPEYAEA